ncbi:MAG: glycosyltransferase family 2 protein [Anaerolineales bacterium]
MCSAGPLFSIITPSLNQRAFISHTIESVLAQREARIEFRVMDGGSTDGTRELLHSYGDRLQWVSEPDGGQSAAVNQGWRQAQGEIVTYLNSDDVLLPGALNQVADFFEQFPEVDAVYGDCDYVDERGALIRPYPTQPYNYARLVREAVNYIPQPAMFFRRRVLETEGYLDESLHYLMDFDYWLRLGVRHTLAYLPERLAALRLHTNAKSSHAVGGFAPEYLCIYQKLFARADLPAHIRALQTEAQRNCHYQAAYCAFWARDFAAARRYAFQAWRYAPLRPRRTLALTVGGPLAYAWLHRRGGHPFQLRPIKPWSWPFM